MKGVQYVVDDAGERHAVVIDLHQHGELWDDFYDTWLTAERATEPREDLHTLKDKLGLDGG